MTQHNDFPRTPEPRSYSPYVPIPDRRRSDRLSDGALNYATCLVVTLVAATFLASVAILSCTALSLAFDEPVAVASVAYENPTKADMHHDKLFC
ncbi:MAG TPA: hypothetical protein VFT23_08875 [Burkholderiales bacterium]|nr:hypothetical protein [Burkholderiales bacterium]